MQEQHRKQAHKTANYRTGQARRSKPALCWELSIRSLLTMQPQTTAGHAKKELRRHARQVRKGSHVVGWKALNPFLHTAFGLVEVLNQCQ